MSRTAASVVTLLAVLACAGEVPAPQGPPEPVELQPDLTIGLIEGDSAYLFGDIRSLAVDAEGRVYVGDRIGATIRAYDADGTFLKRIARSGGGPGEIYFVPADMTLSPEGGIHVRDASRVTVFAPPSPGALADSVTAVWPAAGYGNITSARSRVTRDGAYYYPGGRTARGEAPRYFYYVMRAGELTGDTLDVPSHEGMEARSVALARLGETDALMLNGLSHMPFAAVPVWDATLDGTVLSTDGRTYAILETDLSGDTIRTFLGPTRTARPVPAAERADSATALDARIDSLPIPLADVDRLGAGIRERRWPASLPALIGIHVATDGAVWVELWPLEGRGDTRLFDVFGANGRFQRRVLLNAPLRRDPPPFFGASHIAGVVMDPATGVQRVVRFRVP